MSDETKVLEILKKNTESAVRRKEWGVAYLLERIQEHPLLLKDGGGSLESSSPVSPAKTQRFTREDFGEHGIFERNGDKLSKLAFSSSERGYYVHTAILADIRQVGIVVGRMTGSFNNKMIKDQTKITPARVTVALSWMRENKIITEQAVSVTISDRIQRDINKAWNKTTLEEGGFNVQAHQA